MNKKYFDSKEGSVEDKISDIASKQPSISAEYKPNVKLSAEKTYFETKPGSIADAASKVVSEGIEDVVREALDTVNPVAVKKKFDDRKDKDIDNDGDTDSTDKYLHKKRVAISKDVKKEACQKTYKELRSETKPATAESKLVKLGDKGKTATGKSAGVIELEPFARPI